MKLRTDLNKLFCIALLCLLSCPGFSQNMTHDDLDALDNEYTVVSHDTLTMVGLDNTLYYPFGKHTKIKEIARYHKGYAIRNLPIGEDTVLKCLSKGDSFSVFYSRPEDERENSPLIYDIVYAIYTDSNIVLGKKIHPGMTISEFAKVVGIIGTYDDISVIKCASSLTGVWSEFIFSEGILSKIVLTTDFLFFEEVKKNMDIH